MRNWEGSAPFPSSSSSSCSPPTARRFLETPTVPITMLIRLISRRRRAREVEKARRSISKTRISFPRRLWIPLTDSNFRTIFQLSPQSQTSSSVTLLAAVTSISAQLQLFISTKTDLYRAGQRNRGVPGSVRPSLNQGS